MNPDNVRVTNPTLTLANPQYSWACQGIQRLQGKKTQIANNACEAENVGIPTCVFFYKYKLTLTTLTHLTKPESSKATACQGSDFYPDNFDKAHFSAPIAVMAESENLPTRCRSPASTRHIVQPTPPADHPPLRVPPGHSSHAGHSRLDASLAPTSEKVSA